MYDSKTREKRYTCRAFLMNVKVIENLSLLTPLAFGCLSTDITENFCLSQSCQTPSYSLEEGATPYNGLYREGRTIGGTFRGLRVYSDVRVGISLVEAFLKGQGNLPFRSVNQPKRATVGFYGCEKVGKIV